MQERKVHKARGVSIREGLGNVVVLSDNHAVKHAVFTLI